MREPANLRTPPKAGLPLAQSDLEVDGADARLERHEQAWNVQTGHQAASTDNEHGWRDISSNAGALQEHARAPRNHIPQLADTAASQRIKLVELLTHHLPDDRQSSRFGHAVHDRARQSTRHTDDRGYFASFEITPLDGYRATTYLAAKFLFEDTFGSQQERLSNIRAHTQPSTEAAVP
jgi:hypothetical protein